MDDEMTVSEAANLLNLSSSTVRRLIDEGKLASRRTPGGHRRIVRREVERVRSAV